jgi:hypothetical protein
VESEERKYYDALPLGWPQYPDFVVMRQGRFGMFPATTKKCLGNMMRTRIDDRQAMQALGIGSPRTCSCSWHKGACRYPRPGNKTRRVYWAGQRHGLLEITLNESPTSAGRKPNLGEPAIQDAIKRTRSSGRTNWRRFVRGPKDRKHQLPYAGQVPQDRKPRVPAVA